MKMKYTDDWVGISEWKIKFACYSKRYDNEWDLSLTQLVRNFIKS